jgi:predicted TIM-barrel fold metal-dependent hydrolase
MDDLIIDSHVHVYPPLAKMLDTPLEYLPWGKTELTDLMLMGHEGVQEVKSKLKPLLFPGLNKVHQLTEKARLLPERLVPIADKLQGITGIYGVLLEGQIEDLQQQMETNSISYSVVIAHPPITSNEYVLQLSQKYHNIIPVVNVPKCSRAVDKLQHYIEMGAKALKIHAASDGLDAFDQHYLDLLEVANEHKLPVIIHTGCLYIKPLYRAPHMGHAEHFESWFKNYPDTNFILAHMNIHYPQVAIDLCREYANLYTDVSWQPASSIAHAVNTLGAERIMFGTDWPIVGNNMQVGLERIQQLVDKKAIMQEDARQVKALTAADVFSIDIV